MTLRSVTNLTPNEDLALPKNELKSGFLYVYNKGYTGLEPVFMTKLWASALFPSLTSNVAFGKDRKGVRRFADHFGKVVAAELTNLVKVPGPVDALPINGGGHFLVSVPLEVLNTKDLSYDKRRIQSQFLPDVEDSSENVMENHLLGVQERLGSDVGADGKTVGSVTYTFDQLGLNLPGNGYAELRTALKAIRLVARASVTVVFADFYVSARIAQQLTNTPFVEIRPIDLYPLMLEWVAGCFGYSSATPLSSFPVSKIARTLPPVAEGDARINEHNLSIGPDGTPYWLPEKLDNTTRYEDMFSQVGSRADGGFRIMDIGDETNTRKMPPNVPVLIDWVNNKYSYTLSSGFLKVQDLTRFKKADHSHIYNLMTRYGLDPKMLGTFINMGISAGVSDAVNLSEEDVLEMNELLPGSGDALKMETNLANYSIRAFNTYRVSEEMAPTDNIQLLHFSLSGSPYFRPIARFIVQTHAAILQNLDAVNARFAVSTVSVTLAYITLIAKYASEFDDVVMKANAIRGAAMRQGVDDSWKPPSVPLLSDKIGMLPHQLKVRNLLKESPDFAILPVQAGGGKSVLTITDVLYEIKANTNNPYLILCPPHLVAQYVKEIVYFTSGQINVITINSYCIRRHGLDRLTEMISTAPRNSVVVCDYDVLRAKQQQVCYGTAIVPVYPVIEFLRQFRFGYAMLDESHSVKNDTNRTRACMALIADIPKKRLASGTMAHDSPSDLALQVAMLDPTLFGSRTEFNEKFGETVSGDRVMKWKVGAQKNIMSIIRSRIVVAGAMRKEWAALLPKATEKFHPVELSPAQRDVYDAIFAKTEAELRRQALTNKTLAKFLGLAPQDEEDLNAKVDENEGEDLAAALNPYLARLEQFISAPARDEMGDQILKGDDRLPPKLRTIVQCIREHLDANLPGKVLIFTNYTASAEEVYENLPDDIKAQAILYVAADKVETGAKFEKDPRVKVMIGVENSMNTGLNLQHVSRLIRMETVWNPGTLEQGNSRVNRPELKATEARAEIFYDWIICANTIDVTKISRLISKVIAIGKFENTESDRYQDIDDLPVIPMTLDAIKNLNSWDAQLRPYSKSYAQYQQAQKDEYAEYRQQYERRYGTIRLSDPIPVADVPADAALLSDVTYTPGLELFDAGALGLIRVDEYLRQDTFEDEAGGEDPTGEDAATESSAEGRKRQALVQNIIGQKVHTEYGDGILKSASMGSKLLNVSLTTGPAVGNLVRVKMSAAFLITRPSDIPVRDQIMKAVGTVKKIKEPLSTLSDRMRPDSAGLRRAEQERIAKEKEAKKAKEKEAAQLAPIELIFSVSNGFLGVTYFTDENNASASNALQALGFRPTEPFAYAHMKTANHLLKQFNAWRDEGYTLDDTVRKAGISRAIADLHSLLKNNKLGGRNVNFNFSTRNELKNFYRTTQKPATSTTEIKPYPMIEDGLAYIVLPLRGQPASKAAMRVRIPGVKWELSQPSLVYYGLDLADTSRKIKEILDAGIQISNIKDLKLDFKRLHKVNLRKDEDSLI